MTVSTYRVRGTTDDVTSCDCCGRVNLKKTVVLEILDGEGNGTGEVRYFGTDCAAKASGWTQREVKAAAKDADAAKRAEAARLSLQRAEAEIAAFHAWLQERTGKADVMEATNALGGFAAARAEYRSAVAAAAEREAEEEAEEIISTAVADVEVGREVVSRLFRYAVKLGYITPRDIPEVMRIAAACSAVAGASGLDSFAVSEALQYRSVAAMQKRAAQEPEAYYGNTEASEALQAHIRAILGALEPVRG